MACSDGCEETLEEGEGLWGWGFLKGRRKGE